MAIAQLVVPEGTLINSRYQVVRTVSQRAHTTVLEAVDLRLERNVAIKLLSEASSTAATVRFERERALLTRLSSAKVVPCIDTISVPGQYFGFVMPWLEGSTLEERLKTKKIAVLGPAPRPAQVTELLQLGIEIARALDVLHKAGIVHRDLKPSNIFVGNGAKTRDVTLLDLGVASSLTDPAEDLTHDGTLIGTPLYMAPEQIRSPHNVTPAADIYALGCVLYRLLTGQVPHAARDSQSVITGRLRGGALTLSPSKSAAQTELNRLVRLMLSASPNERPTASAVVDSLRSLCADKVDVLPAGLNWAPAIYRAGWLAIATLTAVALCSVLEWPMWALAAPAVVLSLLPLKALSFRAELLRFSLWASLMATNSFLFWCLPSVSLETEFWCHATSLAMGFVVVLSRIEWAAAFALARKGVRNSWRFIARRAEAQAEVRPTTRMHSFGKAGPAAMGQTARAGR